MSIKKCDCSVPNLVLVRGVTVTFCCSCVLPSLKVLLYKLYFYCLPNYFVFMSQGFMDFEFDNRGN
jgi:hypothetical protein